MASVSLCPKCHYASPRFNFLIPDEHTSMDRAYTPPTAVEIDRVASTVPTIGDDISFLDKEIARFQATLTSMKLVRRRLKRDAAQWNVYLSPSGIRRLPVEVLEIIFELACDSSEPEAFVMPLSLSWTCFKWRQIVLHRPQLWTHIYASPSVKQSLVNLYIKRSGTAPLSVKIENFSSMLCYDYGSTSVHSDHPQILALYEVSERWAEADILMYDGAWEILQLFCDDGNLPLPTLRILSFGVEDNKTLRCSLGAFMMPNNVLEQLILDDNGYALAEDSVQFEWGKITNIKTNFTGVGMEVLNMAYEQSGGDDSFLREDEASFRHITVNGQVSGIVPGMVVTSLEIAPCAPGWTQMLLDNVASLRLPKLRNLSLVFNLTDGGSSPESQVAPSPIQNFVTASSCTLTHLRILVQGVDSGYTISPAELHTLLSRTPQLTHLSIVEDAPTLLTDEFLAVFSGFCPEIEELELVWAFESPAFTEARLLQMIELRLAPYGALRLLVLGTRDGGNVSKDIRDFMKRIREGPVCAHLW